MRRVRDLARREGRQISEVVNELLVAGLIQRRAKKSAPRALPAFNMGRPRVNLSDRDALEAVMGS
ncbi:MAG: hypothetical protein HY903_02580 [Deltaproteobacteria bacterium]|nr:hypothetical protein [Deltaproteobacteria bacterium]